jgi:hypothetical protein
VRVEAGVAGLGREREGEQQPGSGGGTTGGGPSQAMGGPGGTRR